MSMLSSMTEKMRETADEVERIENAKADCLWRDRLPLMNAARELRDAADVIDNLRCSCNDLQFENERLRESYGNLRSAMWDRAHMRAIQHMEEDELRGLCADLYDHIDELRELAREMLRYIDPVEHQDTCGMECPAHETCAGKSMCSFPDWAIATAREIGIEVEQ